jgi:hypothetical protein
MTENQQRYSLQILFDSKQITLEELHSKAENALQKYLPDIKLKVDAPHSANIQLAIKGTLKVVDACHDKINQIIHQSQLKFVRRLDEAGDEIRRQAYSILSEIEQRFRVFVSQALVEVLGFDWWDSLAPNELRSKVQSIREKSQEDGISLDPLECTQFDDLIKLITAEVSEWSEDKHLYVTDILELLSSSDSLTEVRNHLKNKLKKHSFWDIFAQYFQDKQQWEQMKKSLNFVINERHKVMHHRPIRFGVLDALQNKKRELFTLLESAKTELLEQERTEAQQEVRDLREILAQIKERIPPLVQQQNSQLATQLKGIIDPLLQQNSQLEAQLKRSIDSLLQQNSQLAAQLKRSIDPLLQQQNSQLAAQLKGIIDPLLLQQNSQLTAQLKERIPPLVLQQNSQLAAQLKRSIDPLLQQNSQLAAQMKGLIHPSLL